MKRFILAAVGLLGLLGLAHAVNLTGTNNTSQEQILKAGFFRMSVSDNVAATAGGAQAGTAIVSGYSRIVTVASANDSVQLPKCQAGGAPDTLPPGNTDGLFLVITNAHASNSARVYGQTGQTINAIAANSPYDLAAGKTAMFLCSPAGTGWFTILGG